MLRDRVALATRYVLATALADTCNYCCRQLRALAEAAKQIEILFMCLLWRAGDPRCNLRLLFGF